ncbi:hypothetical protein HK101_008272 [Irineochytrium annulatum]|nr:hypothetical protein HK101_008272 [Irineochytrium annulatum]
MTALEDDNNDHDVFDRAGVKLDDDDDDFRHDLKDHELHIFDDRGHDVDFHYHIRRAFKHRHIFDVDFHLLYHIHNSDRYRLGVVATPRMPNRHRQPPNFPGALYTVETCTGNATQLGYSYAGLEYGGECWADNQFRNVTPAVTASGECNAACNANPMETCGAGSRLSGWVFGSGTTPTSPGGGGTPTPTPTPVANQTFPTGWSYAGCYTEGSFGRSLSGTQIQSIPAQSMTNELCATACFNAGYTIAGTEYAEQCYCGSDVRNGGALAPASDCSFKCTGNAGETCGAGGRLSVYAANASNVTVWPAPTTKKTGLTGQYGWVGCYQDNVDSGAGPVRTLAWQFISQSMTVELCLGFCNSFGYTYAGVEYGNECYCDDALHGPPAVNGETECNVPCAANPGEYCGAGGRLGVYKWATPVTTFNKPVNTGYYQYLMGGVIVPLMSALTINNKIVLMEKLAGGAANTTHAYEYDYMDTNYTTCFREMHVVTDFFCSAALMLPDAPGRILNVGGWADISLEGVRIYNPAAAPPNNDWQENPSAVHLQLPRWYPTAVTLRNGSVAVIGGETNSNGQNQPNMELVPPTGTPPVVLNLLQRTDPFNLYPHAIILPSGNLFLVADSQAEIIDPITFATLQVLPNLPAAAFSTTGNVLGSGGRTYPMSGTAVIIPQSPPYNTPMEVLICGGSLGPGGSAIDNCVRGAPEAPGGVGWYVERMPFKRVMPNMVALPDGTFLILNGCQVGVGGFGLGSVPTFTAVLYDPFAPKFARMSILNTTIVARLYHSEAILLHDGRVLVTGSDPQEAEQGYPEEYRIEVYVPPYLSSGLPRPTFILPSGLGSVAFGGKFTITNVVLPSGGSVRASLVAPGVNTHGNSMGMRSCFVTVSAVGGGTYTVTMPPVEVMPDGHYLLFVLDGPTPSIGQWVRLGGDPANIAAWPAAGSGFALP